MAHKTFISYKYSEAQDLRDALVIEPVEAHEEHGEQVTSGKS